MDRKRVVVTGMGMISPIGNDVQESWKASLSGESGVKLNDAFETEDFAVKICGQVSNFDVSKYMSAKEARRLDPFIQLGISAAKQAIEDAGLSEETEDRERVGVAVGSGIGGIGTIEETHSVLVNSGPRRVSPFFIPGRLINLASGHISIRNNFKGPNHSVVTACSTGSHAIGDASRLIAFGDADVMVAGGTESPLCRLSIAGFAACRALSSAFNDKPTEASRPFDEDRDGFVMGEGAGVVVLEEYEHAIKRGAKIYAEVKGYGLSGDAFHITSPSEDGDGGFRSMSAALNNSGIALDNIDYINAHGTSTPAGDEIEIKAVERLFGEHSKNLYMSSTKSSIGHLLGAAGSVEAIFSIMAINTGKIPATLNLDNICVDTKINLVPKKSLTREVKSALSNSFGFGGTNASLIFTKV